jgi:hypothetical protein
VCACIVNCRVQDEELGFFEAFAEVRYACGLRGAVWG